jgi:hypothetical protein
MSHSGVHHNVIFSLSKSDQELWDKEEAAKKAFLRNSSERKYSRRQAAFSRSKRDRRTLYQFTKKQRHCNDPGHSTKDLWSDKDKDRVDTTDPPPFSAFGNNLQSPFPKDSLCESDWRSAPKKRYPKDHTEQPPLQPVKTLQKRHTLPAGGRVGHSLKNIRTQFSCADAKGWRAADAKGWRAADAKGWRAADAKGWRANGSVKVLGRLVSRRENTDRRSHSPTHT